MEISIFKRDFPVNIIFSFILIFMVWQFGEISRISGIVLLLCMAFYLFLTIRAAIKSKVEDGGEDTSSDIYKYFNRKLDSIIPSETTSDAILSILFCIVGLTAIILGGDMVVDNASAIASAWGLSDTLI